MGNNVSSGEATGGGFLTAIGIFLSFTPVGPIAGPLLIPTGLSMMSGKDVPIGGGITYSDDGKGINPFIGEPHRALVKRVTEVSPLKEYHELKSFKEQLKKIDDKRIQKAFGGKTEAEIKSIIMKPIERSNVEVSTMKVKHEKSFPILIKKIDSLDTVMYSIKEHYKQEKSIYKEVVNRLNELSYAKPILGMIATSINVMDNIHFLASHEPEVIGGAGYTIIDNEINEDYKSVLSYVKKINELMADEKELKIIKSNYDTKYRGLVPEIKWKQIGDHSKTTLARIEKLEKEINEKITNETYQQIINMFYGTTISLK